VAGAVVETLTDREQHPGRRLEEPVSPVGDVLISAEQLQQRVCELGAQVAADYQGRQLLLVGVLKGAFVFMSDLARAISLPVEIDFMSVSSYGLATTSSGVVRIIKDLDSDIAGRDVLIVEDIIDSGLTLNYLMELLAARGPASLEICALLVRAGASTEGVKYVGFAVPPDWVIGYGLDVAEYFRDLPSVHIYNHEAVSI